MKFNERIINLEKGLMLGLKNYKYAWKFLSKCLRKKTLFDYNFYNGYSFYPNFITWEITYKCNLRCKMCWVKKSKDAKKYWDNELSFGEAKKIIDQISKFKPVVCIGGGEPLVREDIADIIGYMKEKNLICSITTNGTLCTEELAKKIIESGIDSVTISLDGTKEIDEKIRGKGVFDKSVNGIKLFIEIRGSKKLPLIKINSVISELNFDKISELVHLTKNLGVDQIQFQHLWFTDESCAKSHDKLLERLYGLKANSIYNFIQDTNSVDIDLLFREIEKIKKFKGISVGFCPNLSTKDELEKYYKDLNFKFVKKCLFPWLGTTIKANGDLVPCIGHTYPEYVLGNLKNESFENIWNNEKSKNFRTSLKKLGVFPACSRCCGLFEVQ